MSHYLMLSDLANRLGSCTKSRLDLRSPLLSDGLAGTSTTPYANLGSPRLAEGKSLIHEAVDQADSVSGTSYGLILDSTFNRNSSATSPAYNNEVLCAGAGIFSDSATPFECLGIEVWGTQA
jgi:hypothetical protein